MRDSERPSPLDHAETGRRPAIASPVLTLPPVIHSLRLQLHPMSLLTHPLRPVAAAVLAAACQRAPDAEPATVSG